MATRRRQNGYHLRLAEVVQQKLLAYTERENARRTALGGLVPLKPLTASAMALIALDLGLALLLKTEALTGSGCSACPWCGRDSTRAAGPPAASDDGSALVAPNGGTVRTA